MEPTPPSPIPVVGDVQVFLDSECTQYATGTVDTVYVRINVPWGGLNSGWSVGSPTSASSFFDAIAPSSDYPDDDIYFNVWVDFIATLFGPYSAGQVVPATFPDPFDVTGYTTVFSRP